MMSAVLSVSQDKRVVPAASAAEARGAERGAEGHGPVDPDDVIVSLQRDILDSMRLAALPGPPVIAAFIVMSWGQPYRHWICLALVGAAVFSTGVLHRTLAHERRSMLVVVGMYIVAVS